MTRWAGGDGSFRPRLVFPGVRPVRLDCVAFERCLFIDHFAVVAHEIRIRATHRS